MSDFKHLDIEKVSQRDMAEWLRIARLQGQWTATKSLQHQAQLLGTEGPLLRQFEVAIERIESQLPVPDEGSASDDDSANTRPLSELAHPNGPKGGV